MATALGRQLARLTAPQTALVIHKKARPSLLFDKREAALLDRETIFSIGVDGFEDLVNLNPDFIKFQDTLFSENAKTMERAIQTQDVNDKLDQVIDEFLCLLCPYFLLKPAQKAMEWLIYRFHIQEFNVNALLRCIFPYHDTNIFARAVQLLQIQDETDRWHWLQPLQDPGVPLSKGALSARCADNPAFMKFLCVMNKKLVQVHGGRSGALEAPVALFAGVLCLALQRTETVTERQVALLAPHVLRCVRSPLTQLRAAGYLLAGQLSRRAGLSAELTARLLTALVEGVDGPLAAEAVAALAVVVHTQAVARLPAGALQLLTASPAPLTGALDRLPGGVSLLPLVSCLLRTCLLEAAGGDSTAAAMATAVAASARIESTSEQQLLIRCVASVVTERAAEAEWAPLLAAGAPVLAALERQYPAPFTAALASLPGGARPASALRAALRGRHAVSTVDCALVVELSHPDESTRRQAARRLLALLRAGTQVTGEVARGALAAALAGRSERLVRQALRVPIQRWLELVGAEPLTELLADGLDGGASDEVGWLCARGLAELFGLQRRRAAGTAPPAALLTALLPTAWTEATAHHLAALLPHILPPEAAAALAEAAAVSHWEYTAAALRQLAALLAGLSPGVRRAALAALAARLASARVSLPARCAAAALASTVLRSHSHGAVQVVRLIRSLLDRQQVEGEAGAAAPPVTSEVQLICERAAGGALPAALLRLLATVAGADGRAADSEWPWRGADEHGAPLTELFAAAAGGLSQRPPLCTAVVAAIFRERLTTLSSQLAFLSQFWSGGRRSVTVQTAALSVSAALLTAAPAHRLPPLLAADQPLVAALLVALLSPRSQVRAAAIQCLTKLSTAKVAKAKCALLPLVDHVTASGPELIADAGALPRCLAGAGRPAINHLVRLVVAESASDHVRAALASLLPPLANQSTLRACAPVLSGLVAECAGGARPAAARAQLAAALLGLVRPATAGALADAAVWAPWAAALSDASDLLQAPALRQVTKALWPAMDDTTQARLLALLLDLCTDARHAEEAARLHKVLRRAPLPTELWVEQLGVQPPPAASHTVRRTSRARSAPAADPTLAADEADVTGRVWRRRRLLLEALAARRRPGDEALLVGALLALLRRLLCVADQPGAEYLTQLGLSCVQQACGHLLRQGRPPATFSVDTLVQCVRRSPSPHTQQLALTVLGQAARIVPETVLHNTMAVFTFMGSSMLRQDTEYSFDVIQRTVENVVPALVQASELVGTAAEPLAAVLRVFVDALPDVPRHRRLPLFAHLLRTAGERRHLGLCLAMISDQLATRGDLGDQLAEHTVLAAGDRGAPLLVDFAVSLCGQFAVDVQLESCCQLISHSEALLLRHHESAGRAPDTGGGDGPALFDLDAYSEKQLHRHCHTAISVVAHLLASETFVVQSAALDAAGAAAARQRHQQLLEGAIRLMGVCSRLCHSALAGRPQATRHLRAILHRLYDLLDKVNALLPWATLLPVVSALMASDLAAVRRRAMDLLASRLQLQHDGFSESDVPALLAITDELVAAAGAESEDGSALSRQTALFAVKLLSRRLSADQPRHFVQVLGAVCSLAAGGQLPAPLLASVLLCLAELVAGLRAHAVGRLPAVAAVLLAALSDSDRLSDQLLLLSAVTLTLKLTEALAHFISPYVADLVAHVSRLSAAHGTDGAGVLSHRLSQTRRRLATGVPLRVLLPAVDQCFGRLVADGAADALAALMPVLSDAARSADVAELSAALPSLQALIVRALEFRAAGGARPATARRVEAAVLEAVTCVVPRLSEATFGPLLVRLLDWASGAGAPTARLVTFFRLTDALAGRLQGLFVLFAGHLVRPLAAALSGASSLSERPLLPGDEEGSCELAEYALDTLTKVCQHDTEGFLNSERFHVLLQPLVDQLENEQGAEERRQRRVHGHLVPCLVAFLAAAGDDSLWKPANHQLLLKTRHQSPQVRLDAVASLSAVHARLGDDYLALLPETMPFLAELLEDDEPRVEAATQALIGQMEATLGESLQQYF